MFRSVLLCLFCSLVSAAVTVDFSHSYVGSGAVQPAPGDVPMNFKTFEKTDLSWSDSATDDLGYIVEQSVDGAAFEVVSESGLNHTSVAVSVVEDAVLRVSSYNAAGEAGAWTVIDLLAPENWRIRTIGAGGAWGAAADLGGVANIWEYAFGTDPLDPASNNRVSRGIIDAGTNTWLWLVVPRDALRDVLIEGRVSSNLWSGRSENRNVPWWMMPIHTLFCEVQLRLNILLNNLSVQACISCDMLSNLSLKNVNQGV